MVSLKSNDKLSFFNGFTCILLFHSKLTTLLTNRNTYCRRKIQKCITFIPFICLSDETTKTKCLFVCCCCLYTNMHNIHTHSEYRVMYYNAKSSILHVSLFFYSTHRGMMCVFNVTVLGFLYSLV